MKDIFAGLYNKIIGFFNGVEQKQDESKNVACNRLKFVLMQDRTNLNPRLLERLRGEMIELLSKYVEMDKEALDLNFEQEGDSIALMLSIPVIRAKDEEEIEAILKEEDEKKKQLETVVEEAIEEVQEDGDVEEVEELQEVEEKKDDDVELELELEVEEKGTLEKEKEEKSEPDKETLNNTNKQLAKNKLVDVGKKSEETEETEEIKPKTVINKSNNDKKEDV